MHFVGCPFPTSMAHQPETYSEQRYWPQLEKMTLGYWHRLMWRVQKKEKELTLGPSERRKCPGLRTLISKSYFQGPWANDLTS